MVYEDNCGYASDMNFLYEISPPPSCDQIFRVPQVCLNRLNIEAVSLSLADYNAIMISDTWRGEQLLSCLVLNYNILSNTRGGAKVVIH